MRRLLTVIALVGFGFAAQSTTTPAQAIDCEFCEVAGVMEGAGIITPNPFDYFDVVWEGTFTGAEVGTGPIPSVGVPQAAAPVTYTMYAEGRLFTGNPIPFAHDFGIEDLPPGLWLEGDMTIGLWELGDDPETDNPVHMEFGALQGNSLGLTFAYAKVGASNGAATFAPLPRTSPGPIPWRGALSFS